LGSGTGRLLLECALLLGQGLLGFSGPEALRAAGPCRFHLSRVRFGVLLQACLDLFVLLIEPTHHWPQLGQGMHLRIGKVVLLVRVLFLSHN
jgi:hypothetical protein